MGKAEQPRVEGCPCCKLIESIRNSRTAAQLRNLERDALLKVRELVESRLSKLEPEQK